MSVGILSFYLQQDEHTLGTVGNMTGSNKRQHPLVPCSFLGVANTSFDSALEKEVMVSWQYGSESI